MRSLRDLDHQLYVALAWLVLAGIGWWLRSTPLAIIGVLGALTTGALYLWQRECLVGVTYRRKLGQTRATFDERVSLEIEVLNDKILPLSWFRVEDDVPSALSIEGGTVVAKRINVNILVNLLPMLPYQRVRRQLCVVCNQRGEHTFGPSLLSSGDPVGLRIRSKRVLDVQHLLVYPKVFAIAPAGIASHVLIGEERSRFELVQDPSRFAGVREYRPGDPLRHVDWRATARSTALLVRQFEPSVTFRVALFVDFQVALFRAWVADTGELEFTIAVAASIISELSQRKIATGLFSSGVVAGNPLAYPPSGSPAALPTMLEALACFFAVAQHSLPGGTERGVREVTARNQRRRGGNRLS